MIHFDQPAYRVEAASWAEELIAHYGDEAIGAANAMLRLARAGGIPDHVQMCEELVAMIEASGRQLLFQEA